MPEAGKEVVGYQKATHPAYVLYLVTLILLGIMVLLGFIAVFIPWVQKDIAVGKRAYAYPFKTCIVDTFSTINLQTCQDNDFIQPGGTPLTGGEPKCRAYVQATIAFVFISVILGVVTIILLIFVILNLWARPFLLAAVSQIGLIIVAIAAVLAWIMFIVYAETTCAPNSIFPVQGYSYGWICYIFASTAAMASVVTGFLGLKKLKSFQPLFAGGAPDDERLLQAPAENAPYMASTPYFAPYPYLGPTSYFAPADNVQYTTPVPSFNTGVTPQPAQVSVAAPAATSLAAPAATSLAAPAATSAAAQPTRWW